MENEERKEPGPGYYVLLDGLRFGPYPIATLESLLKDKQITQHTRVQEVGTAQWVELHTIPGFGFRPTIPAPGPTPAVLNSRQLQQMMNSAKELEQKTIEKPEADPAVHRSRNPILAAVLSLLIAGLGQIYNHDWLKGAFMFFTTVGLVIFLTRYIWLPLALWASVDAYIGALQPDQTW